MNNLRAFPINNRRLPIEVRNLTNYFRLMGVWYLQTKKMADKKEMIDRCLTSTKGLRSSISQIFEDFVSKPVSKADSKCQEPLKSSVFVQDLKKHFGNIQKSVK